MSYRMVARNAGGAEMIERVDFVAPAPRAGEVLVRNEAVGVNFIDIYHRSGLYPRPAPIALGSEAAGMVEAVGSAVADLRVGDRVAYLDGGNGAYASHVIAAADRVVPLPDAVSYEVAAAVLLKGCTVAMLVEDCAKARPGQTALVHAAAGGVGSLLVPWLKSIDVSVIAHAGSADKAAIARAAGADEALHCPFDELPNRAREWTAGHGVDIVFDGVGAASWDASLQSVAKRGLIVSFGNASGPVPPVPPLALGRAGSVFLTRPSLFDYAETAADLRGMAARLFDRIADGRICVHVGGRFALENASDAHRALESRTTTGSIVLLP